MAAGSASADSLNLRVSNHPILLHKLTLIRDKNTQSPQFRDLLREVTFYLGYEATADLSVRKVSVQTPVAEGVGAKLAERIALIPIMRAGLGMVETMLRLTPAARVHHIGMYRSKHNLLPILYYNRLPMTVDADVAIVLEPMIATAGTISAAVTLLKEWGVKRIKVLSLIASKPGLTALHEEHPDVEVHVAAVDDTLREDGFIVPGLGDVGDRLWGTCHDELPEGSGASDTPAAGAASAAAAATAAAAAAATGTNGAEPASKRKRGGAK